MATKTYRIINGDSAQELKHIPDNSIDAVVTDPPYGIEFLGKDWDSNTGAVAIWAECHRILKPGGYLLAFSAARTYHHLATNIESVGFEIRDQLMWIYSSGFPKAQDMGRAIDKRAGKMDPKFKGTDSFNLTFGETPGQRLCSVCKKDQTAVYKCNRDDCGQKYSAQTSQGQRWAGWKTALKPGHEPIVMARKRFRGSTIDNIQQHGVGALNIDASRLAIEGVDKRQGKQNGIQRTEYGANKCESSKIAETYIPNPKGRFPSNVMGDIPDYQKYFYCPKVSRRERHCGFEQDQIPDPLENYSQGDVKNHPLWDPSIGTNLQRLKHKILEHNKDLGKKSDPLAHIPTDPSGMLKRTVTGSIGDAYVERREKRLENGNNHPTVKPVALMRYLIQLVTPANSHVVDPFTGSGTTGMAAVELGHRFTGIEQDPAYVEIANKRIQGWLNTQGKPAQPTHIPAPFGSIKGCYDQGERFAVRHQQLQKNTQKHSTAKEPTKVSPYDRLFE